MKLAIFDLDGTLFDTKDVNYYAYKEAVGRYGYSIDYDYYCGYCNGRHYMDFLPQIVGADEEIVKAIHSEKTNLYSKYLDSAVMNEPLFHIIRLIKKECKISLVTTASKKLYGYLKSVSCKRSI